MKKNRKKSFIRNCLIQNSISLLSILGVCLIISTFVNYRLEISFPVIDDLLKYEKYLKYEEYSKIPILKFFECAIIVYDSNNKLLLQMNFDDKSNTVGIGTTRNNYPIVDLDQILNINPMIAPITVAPPTPSAVIKTSSIF